MDDEDNDTSPIHEMLDDKLRVVYFKGYLASVAQAIKWVTIFFYYFFFTYTCMCQLPHLLLINLIDLFIWFPCTDWCLYMHLHGKGKICRQKCFFSCLIFFSFLFLFLTFFFSNTFWEPKLSLKFIVLFFSFSLFSFPYIFFLKFSQNQKCTLCYIWDNWAYKFGGTPCKSLNMVGQGSVLIVLVTSFWIRTGCFELFKYIYNCWLDAK